MPQPNFQADGIQIQPGSSQTLTITRDPLTGSLRFVDNVVTGGINLVNMAGLNTIAGVLVVGQSGTGATYTSISAALAAVPSSASLTNPFIILVMAGVYTENLTINKDGIMILGLGRVVVTPATTTATVTIQGAVSTTPTSLTIKDLTILQPGNGLACVNLVGSSGSTIGTNNIVLDGCTLVASGVGSLTVQANAVNFITLRGCRSDGSSGSAILQVSQCASLDIEGGTHPAIQADYNSAGTIPSVSGSMYALFGCVSVGNWQSTLTGAGAVVMENCPSVGNITMYGNRTLNVVGSAVGNLSLNGTTAATLETSTRGTVAGPGTLSEPVVSGTLTFTTTTTGSVVFGAPKPVGTSYTVALDTGVGTLAYVSAKDNTGFTVTFMGAVTTTVYWTVTQ